MKSKNSKFYLIPGISRYMFGWCQLWIDLYYSKMSCFVSLLCMRYYSPKINEIRASNSNAHCTMHTYVLNLNKAIILIRPMVFALAEFFFLFCCIYTSTTSEGTFTAFHCIRIKISCYCSSVCMHFNHRSHKLNSYIQIQTHCVIFFFVLRSACFYKIEIETI